MQKVSNVFIAPERMGKRSPWITVTNNEVLTWPRRPLMLSLTTMLCGGSLSKTQGPGGSVQRKPQKNLLYPTVCKHESLQNFFGSELIITVI